MMVQKILASALSGLLVFSLAACGGSGSGGADAGSGGSGSSKDVIKLHMSHTQAPNSLSDLTAQKYKELLNEKSGGRIQLQIYTNCGLSGGDLTKALEMVGTGDIDIHSCAPTNAANFDKRFYVYWLPFLFPTTESLLSTCENEEITKAVNGWCNGLNMELLGVNNAGARQLSNSKMEITKPEDLKGLNVRVPGANLFIDLYRDCFGANPTAMDFSEVYTALQQKTIDAQENPVSVFSSSKFQEVQSYLTLWDYVRDTTMWVINKEKLASLSPEDQKIVTECATEALNWGNEYLAENEGKIIEELKAAGVTVTQLTPEQQQAFADASAPLYEKYSAEIGQDVIDLFKKASQG